MIKYSNNTKIKDIKAQEILDSRGNPTVKAIVILDNGKAADAAVPSGASKGTHEAVELRDGDKKRYHGMGVLKAVENIEKIIAPRLKNFDPLKQTKIDQLMIDLDGTENKSKLGANTILAVSLACARAGAYSSGKHLYEYLSDLYGRKLEKSLPTPMFNVINGGLHGCGMFNFQEFMIIPSTTVNYDDALRMGVELYQELKVQLKKRKLTYSVGDEGGFTPNLYSNEDVLKLLKDVIDLSINRYGKDVFLGLDFAASTFYKENTYQLNKGTDFISREKYIDYILDLTKEYGLYSLEDPLFEDDWLGWKKLNEKAGNSTLVVGDDLLVTNLIRLNKAIELGTCNSILVKVNQIGTLSETLNVVKRSKKAGFKVIISHRSGETNDDFIADLAVGVGADFVKFGAPARGERVAKYNRLLQIYSQLVKLVKLVKFGYASSSSYNS